MCCDVMCAHLSCHLVLLVELQMVVLEHHVHRYPLTVGAPVGIEGEGRGGEGKEEGGEGSRG